MKKDILKKLIAKSGEKHKVSQFDSEYTADFTKEQANQLLIDNVGRLAEMQNRLYAQDKYSILVIFQAMDAAGKDGTIKHVMSGVNPQGCQVYSFKQPSARRLGSRLFVAYIQIFTRTEQNRYFQSVSL